MQKYINILKKVDLFQEIEDRNINTMLHCLGAVEKAYGKNKPVFMIGDQMRDVGIVVEGSLQILKEDFFGNRTILHQVEVGDLFAETFACAGIEKSPVTVTSITESKVIFIQFRRLITTCATACSASCEFHNKMIENMMKHIAKKNILLNHALSLLSQRTTAEKLKMYFLRQMEQHQNTIFTIPFSRSELADYLCVERSALSRELGKMRDQGKIVFEKNRFEIKNIDQWDSPTDLL